MNGNNEDKEEVDLYPSIDRRELKPPQWWYEPTMNAEIVDHGAILAQLAIELARLEKSSGKSRSPADCLLDASVLLQRACDLVPHTVNLSRGTSEERDAWLKEHIANDIGEDRVPWKVICSEGKPAHEAPKTNVRLEIDGIPMTYQWKAYVQLEKEGGLKALLFRHATRVAFETGRSKHAVHRLRRILTLWACRRIRHDWPQGMRKRWWQKRRVRKISHEARTADGSHKKMYEVTAKRRKMRKFSHVLRAADLSWTYRFLVDALASIPAAKVSLARSWQEAIIAKWKETSTRDFADRLLESAQQGTLNIATFESIALTRKLNPPGGRFRRKSESD